MSMEVDIVKKLEASLSSSKYIVIDTETTGLDLWNGCRPFAIGIKTDTQVGYLEWPVNPMTREALVPSHILTFLRRLCLCSTPKVFWNAAFDVRALQMVTGVQCRGKIHDAMIMASVCRTNEINYKLIQIAQKYVGIDNEDEKDLKSLVIAGRRIAKKLGWSIHDQVAADYWIPAMLYACGEIQDKPEKCAQYCLKDVQRTDLLFLMYKSILDRNLILFDTYEMERKLWSLCYDMETTGVCINDSTLQEEKTKAEDIRAKLLTEMRQQSWHTFDPSKPVDVKRLLYDQLGLEATTLTDTGQPSTRHSVLVEHNTIPVVKNVLDYRSVDKGITSFFNSYERLKCKSKNGEYCLHPNIRQSGKRTARFSYSSPNLQQVPGVDPAVPDYQINGKAPFEPRPGYVWYIFDYSNLEARLFASIANSEILLQAFSAGEDVHANSANMVFGGKGNSLGLNQAMNALKTDSVGRANEWFETFDYDIVAAEKSVKSKASRYIGKTIFFLKIYAGGKRAIANKLAISEDRAEEYSYAYDQKYPDIRRFNNEMGSLAKRDGHIITLYNRKLDVDPDSYYKAGNYMIQGTAADLIKQAMLRVDSKLQFARILITIHDELVIEVPFINTREKEYHLAKVIKTEMEYDPTGLLRLPTPVDFALVTTNWSEKQEIEL